MGFCGGGRGGIVSAAADETGAMLGWGVERLCTTFGDRFGLISAAVV